MEKAKRQRHDREVRQNLCTFLALTPNLASTEHSSLLAKTHPAIISVNSLRIFAALEINYILMLLLDLSQKSTISNELKVSIIGGGVTGRIILNGFLPLAKGNQSNYTDNLFPSNTTLSTRQTHNFGLYRSHFGIQVIFDNQRAAADADLLIVATPATLDNWIIADLRAPLQLRLNASQNRKNRSDPPRNLPQKSLRQKPSDPSNNSLKSNDLKKKEQKVQQVQKRVFRPLVYILTSDFSDQKAERLFPFPVLTPAVRAGNLSKLAEHMQQKAQENKQQQKEEFQWVDDHEKALIWWLLHEGNRPEESGDQGQSQNKYLKTPLNRILRALSFVIGSSVIFPSISSSASNSISVSQSIKQRQLESRQEKFSENQALDLICAHGDPEETFFKKCKKWRMAHYNFIS